MLLRVAHVVTAPYALIEMYGKLHNVHNPLLQTPFKGWRRLYIRKRSNSSEHLPFPENSCLNSCEHETGIKSVIVWWYVIRTAAHFDHQDDEFVSWLVRVIEDNMIAQHTARFESSIS